MSRLRKQAAHAKALLGSTGELHRVGSLATVYWESETAEWIVSALDSSGDGGIFVTAFSGPLSRERAVEYASEKYSGFQLREPRQH